MKTFRIFCRDRGQKFSGFRDVRASSADSALETVRDLRRFGDPTGHLTFREYWHAVEWDPTKSEGKRKGGPATEAGKRWLEANT